MTRWTLPAALLLLASCASAPPPVDEAATPEKPAAASTEAAAPEKAAAPASPATAATSNGDHAALVSKHNDIWSLMGLSDGAKKELNAIVAAVKAQIETNKKKNPEAFAKAAAVKRAEQPLTREQYIAAHKRRFDALKISDPTQKELLGAAEFVWAALRDPNVAPEKRKVAETIRSMMTAMKGPPPCCDDNIFERAHP